MDARQIDGLPPDSIPLPTGSPDLGIVLMRAAAVAAIAILGTLVVGEAFYFVTGRGPLDHADTLTVFVAALGMASALGFLGLLPLTPPPRAIARGPSALLIVERSGRVRSLDWHRAPVRLAVSWTDHLFRDGREPAPSTSYWMVLRLSGRTIPLSAEAFQAVRGWAADNGLRERESTGSPSVDRIHRIRFETPPVGSRPESRGAL